MANIESKYIKSIIQTSGAKKCITIILNIPPGLKHLTITHLLVKYNDKVIDALLKDNVICPVFGKAEFAMNVDYPNGSILEIRVKRSDNQEYEDKIYELKNGIWEDTKKEGTIKWKKF